MDTAKAPIVIQATLDHADLVSPLFDAYRQFYKQAPNLERVRGFIARRLINRESVIFLALNPENSNDAFGFTQLYPSFSSVAMKRLWILNDLYVSPEFRKRGVASALLEKSRTFAIETGAQGLALSTAVDNATAQQLYEQLGWKKDNEFYYYYLNV